MTGEFNDPFPCADSAFGSANRALVLMTTGGDVEVVIVGCRWKVGQTRRSAFSFPQDRVNPNPANCSSNDNKGPNSHMLIMHLLLVSLMKKLGRLRDQS